MNFAEIQNNNKNNKIDSKTSRHLVRNDIRNEDSKEVMIEILIKYHFTQSLENANSSHSKQVRHILLDATFISKSFNHFIISFWSFS